MLLGFKERFVEYVREGSKTHTIRRISQRRAFRVGDSCDCYANPRQKTMTLLGHWPCVRVQSIEIHQVYESDACPLFVVVDGAVLSADETEGLFCRDGFRVRTKGRFPHTTEAAIFWQSALPFKGQLIHWDHSRTDRRTF